MQFDGTIGGNSIALSVRFARQTHKQPSATHIDRPKNAATCSAFVRIEIDADTAEQAA
jgi:hypothetical protein